MAFAPPFQRPFSATFDRRAAAAAGNGLLNALIAYWPGNEASGNLLDAHTNGLHLTDTNTVTNAAGKVYATARQYTAANSEYHAIADNAFLSAGDVDMTIAAWVYADTLTGEHDIVSKYETVGSQREYRLEYRKSSNRFEFSKTHDGVSVITVQSGTFGAASTGTWYFLIAGHDAANDALFISVNNGALDTTATATGICDGTSPFHIGALGRAAATFFWNGRIGPVAFWKSAAGGGGVLTAAQRSALYNGGAGLAYAAFTT